MEVIAQERREEKVLPIEDATVIVRRREDLLNLKVGTIARIPLEFIVPNEDQPRAYKDPRSIVRSGKTMKGKGGPLHAIDVSIRIGENGPYAFIHDGERRFLACKSAGITSMRCEIHRDAPDDDIFIYSGKANLDREDMSPIEEANLFFRCMKRRGWSEARVAEEFNRSLSHVAQHLKFIKMHEEIQAMLLYRKIDKGIASVLAPYKQEHQLSLLDVITNAVRRRGRPIHPNEATIIVRKEAEKRGWEMAGPMEGKRLKKRMTYSQLMMRKIMRSCQSMLGGMSDLAELTDEQILQSDIHVIDIIKELEKIRGLLTGQINRMEVLE